LKFAFVVCRFTNMLLRTKDAANTSTTIVMELDPAVKFGTST